ncbi:MAG: inactive transglutaminase family protein [Succinivibrionaceae bacterium]
MISRGVYYIVVALLLIIGISLMIYQHLNFEIPWLPNNKNVAWNIEAKVSFIPNESKDDTVVPVNVSLAVPEVQPGFKIINETTASPDYGVAYNDEEGHSRIEWTKRIVHGPQTLYYRIDVLADNAYTDTMMTVPDIQPVIVEEPYLTALSQIKDAAYAKSSDPFSFTREIFKEIKSQEQNTLLLFKNKMSKAQIIVNILNMANIRAKVIKALRLKDGRRNQKLIPYIAVFNEKNEYKMYDPETEEQGFKDNVFVWVNNSNSVIDMTGGTHANVNFSIVRHFVSNNKAISLRHQASEADGNTNLDLSVNALPIEEQAVFKGILLIPIGVLIVVLLRIIVGLKTSGTFMPVLIAMAFLQTNLTVGLIGFISIVGIGLIIRSWLSYLNLLLVARISTVIITVITIIGILSFLTYKIGLSDGIKITFFPMIILSWTIERMSILWEEEGYKEVFKQGGGSLLVAILAYLAMNNLVVQHITFNFLGLQLVILAIVLLVGNYTGYRLSELKRFKPLAKEISQPTGGELEADRLKKEIKQLKKGQ